jgi:beta-alanine--pyruvate transaminase
MRNGVNFKATADALVLAPPFISEEKHIDEIFDKLRKGIIQYMNQKN